MCIRDRFRYLPAFNAFQYAVPRATEVTFTIGDTTLEFTNYFADDTGNNDGVRADVRLQESRDNGLTFTDTGIATSFYHITGGTGGALNAGFVDTEEATDVQVLTGASGEITPQTDYMYRLALVIIRVNEDGDETPNAPTNYRVRVRVRPSLTLTATGNYNLLEGISLGDIEENRVFLLSLIHISEPTRPY